MFFFFLSLTEIYNCPFKVKLRQIINSDWSFFFVLIWIAVTLQTGIQAKGFMQNKNKTKNCLRSFTWWDHVIRTDLVSSSSPDTLIITSDTEIEPSDEYCEGWLVILLKKKSMQVQQNTTYPDIKAPSYKFAALSWKPLTLVMRPTLLIKPFLKVQNSQT